MRICDLGRTPAIPRPPDIYGWIDFAMKSGLLSLWMSPALPHQCRQHLGHCLCGHPKARYSRVYSSNSISHPQGPPGLCTTALRL